MSAPIATESALRPLLTDWLGRSGRARTIVVRAQASWPGQAELVIGNERVRVIEGISGLAALDAMRSAALDESLAVLTELEPTTLGTAVMLDVERQRVFDLDEWSGVPALFGSRATLVSRPVRDLGPWVPSLLAALQRDQTFAPAPGGVVSAEHVVRALLVALLGLDSPDRLELADALTPLDHPGVRAQLADLGAEAREGLLRATSRYIDAHLAMALRVASRSGNVSAVAVGLVVGELWATGDRAPDTATAAARVRIEQYVGPAVSVSAAQRYGSASRLLTRRWLAAGDRKARDTFDQAEAICTDIDWSDGASASDFLPAGLRARVTTFARAVDAAAASPSEAASQAVDEALAAVEAHGARPTFERSLPKAQMAARLARWLAAPAPAGAGLSDAMAAYATDGAWAERALGDIWDGETEVDLAAAYRALAHAVQSVRRREDAAASASVTGALELSGAVAPVEDLLSKLVVPLSAEQLVLLIVLDGMSVPTAIELAAELDSAGWTELVSEGTKQRGLALAALPTVTTYSRTSLLAGELLAGNQQTEKSRFAAATGGTVFHKDDLRSEAGFALPPAVTEAIADRKSRIVGAVLNTIDDALTGADVDALRWSLRDVAKLEALLDAAAAAGRVVILTSDHGHIVERGTALRNMLENSARWRLPDTAPVQPDEVLVTGPRVLSPGGSAVLAVSDGIRYAGKKPGYHGGASLAELSIPIVVLRPRGAPDPHGWVEAPPQEPTWWNEATRIAVPSTTPAPSARVTNQKAPKKVDASAVTLFDAEPADLVASVTPGAAVGLAQSLVASETYIARRGLAGRHPVDEATVVTVIGALEAGGGRAHRDTLAAAAGIAATTFGGLLAALRRVLNVDGYAVIEFDADGATVLLDLALLREQFHLGAA